MNMALQNHITTIPLRHRVCALMLALSMLFSPALAAAAAPTIPGFYGTVPGFTGTSNLPQGGTIRSGVGSITQTSGKNELVITQDSSQLAIDWNSFNIAPGNVVMFNQKKDGVAQPQWAALNRIYSADPSQIFGKLQADGKVYLINSNGILFGAGSVVNTHSLIASNLNITDQNFIDGKLRFTTDSTDPYYKAQGQLDNSKGFVSNYGEITTDSGGTVFFVGPNVVNAGTINAPSGKINLIGVTKRPDGTTPDSGYEVELIETIPDATGNDVTYSDLHVAGTAYNGENGKLITEGGGRIGMYGATVQNDGLIRAVTALKKGGVVFLSARDKVTTGDKSVIESPVDGSAETGGPSLLYNPGVVSFKGLYTAKSGGADVLNALSNIEHQGGIVAPSGEVTLTAQDRIFLGDSSKIDVAGLWLDRSASANLMEAQLNSVYLRDDYGQKSGILLGQKINVDVLIGSSLGDMSTYYQGIEKSAQQRSTTGGSIALAAPTDSVLKELIVKQEAELNFSGGGTRYSTGTMATSRLISGNKVYDLGSAPQWIKYDRVADSQTKRHTRFGVSEEFKGLYFGGGSSVQDLAAARVVGSDAGSVIFNARVATLDGSLNGAVTRGLYQTAVTRRYVSDTTTDNPAYKISVASGLEEPVGGTVIVGQELPVITTPENMNQDFSTTAITVKSAATSNDDLNRTTTEISASMLNKAGLSSLKLFANTSITTEQGAGITLLPGGSYTARARRIEYGGTIDIPDGTVEMTTRPNISTYAEIPSPDKIGTVSNLLYQPLIIENIYLTPGSRISTAGLEIDNSATGMALHPAVNSVHTAGGKISVQEMTEQGSRNLVGTSPKGHSVVVATGALLDVSGGYSVDSKGKITGGNAGTLELKGSTLSLAGELRGYSLPGKTGGEIKLHAGEVTVAARDLVFPANVPVNETIPDYLLGRLVLGEHRLADSGFSRVNLTAINDITFSDGAVLTPSLTKLPMPVPAIVSQSAKSGNTVIPAGSDPTVDNYSGTTSISLKAGLNIYDGPLPPPPGRLTGELVTNNESARINISSGTGIAVAPGGSITIEAPYVDIAGHIEAFGGKVTATANQTGDSLVVETGGQILAGGYNKPVTTTVAGLPAGSLPQAGGAVTLTSKGNVVLEAGSKVDVSGSALVERLVVDSDGKPVKVVVAGDPGTLNLSYTGSLTLDGEIDGKARMDGGRGGTLSVTNSTYDLKIQEADINRYQSSGFDALTFTSTKGSLVFPESLDVTIERSLTLDGVSIKGEQGVDVKLRSPWITVTNTDSTKLPASGTATTGTASLSLLAEGADGTGGFLDVTGSVRMDGFSDVTLQAGRDIRLSDLLYTKYAGDLKVGGDLTLKAARVYPRMFNNPDSTIPEATDFTISTPGKVTIQPGAVKDDTPIYSAGGSLTIAAAGGIEHSGTLAAPQGNITLIGGTREKVVNPDGTFSYNDILLNRVYLAEGSIVTTAGSTAVPYGSYDGSTWTIKNTGVKGPEVTSAPSKSITLKGKDVIVREGAVQDISGGGSVYTTLFQPGIPGSVNPLTKSGRYVIMADNSVKLPGAAIYLDAAPEFGLKAGVYSVLPADYAFMPGALVIEDSGINLTAGQKALSTQGYQVVAGYSTITDTSIGSQLRKGYSVRTAADVLKEGDYTVKSFTAGDGGDFTLKATSGAVYAGTLAEKSLAGFIGGIFSFSAKNVLARNTADTLDASFNFDTITIPKAMADDTLQLSAATVSNREINELKIGDKDVTTTVTVQSGVTLQAPSITLTAKDSVTIEGEGEVRANGGEKSGIAAIVTPTGTFTLKENGVLHASNKIRLDVRDTLLKGDMSADNNSLSLTADRIVFAADGTPRSPGALYLDEVRWSGFSRYTDLTLASRNDMEFLKNVNLSSAGSLTLDAARYLGSIGATDVKFTAATRLTLLNSGATATTTGLIRGSTALTLAASEIVVAPRLLDTKGNIVFDKFKSVTLNSSNDLILKGAGTLTTGGDLTLSAARVTTSYYKYDKDSTITGDVSIPYTAAAITLDASSGAVKILGSSNGTAGNTATPGGSLKILGDSITQTDGVLEVASGRVTLSAKNNITIDGASRIQATGSKSPEPMQPDVYSYSPGGNITLESSTGTVTLAGGSTLDVQASDQGDAGSIKLSAVTGGVTMSGTIKGKAENGQGGSFAIDSARLDGSASVGGLDLDRLSAILSDPDAGFNNKINIRSRAGDLTLSSGNEMTGREVVIAADGGAIDLSGKIIADTTDGSGRIELYSGTTLNLESGSILSAKGKDTGANGGTVMLSSQSNSINALNVKNGSKIYVNGNGGTDGTVAFRAYRNAGNNEVNMGAVNGQIIGASKVSVEAVKAYSNVTDVGSIVTTSGYGKDAYDFLTAANSVAIKNRLFGAKANDVANHLHAGIEISSAVNTDLTVDQALDLSNVRPGSEAVVLTLKSGKNLNITRNITDAKTAIGVLHSNIPDKPISMQDTTAFNLVAGSDGGANYMGVAKGDAFTDGTGDLTINNGTWVYTENGPIRFAAGKDANFGGTSTGSNLMINADMKYNLGSYGGTVRGNVGRDLKLESAGSAIQTALGDIDIRVGNDVTLGDKDNTGAIRTTGEYTGKIEIAPGITDLTGLLNPLYTPENGKPIVTPDYTNPYKFMTSTLSSIAKKIYENEKNAKIDATATSYWTYHNGGNIIMDVAGSMIGNLDAKNGWDGAYIDPSITGNDMKNNPWYLAAGFGGSKENAQQANIPVTVGIATMGGGDVSVRTGGSLLTQVGAFGRTDTGNLTVTSGGDMTGRFCVMNGAATLASGGGFGNKDANTVIEIADAQVSVAAQGDVHLGAVLNPDNSRDRIFFGNTNPRFWNMTYTTNSSASISSLVGNATFYDTDSFAAYDVPSTSPVADRNNILPATFSLAAAGDLDIKNKFVLAPSASGNLALYAGGNISGTDAASFSMVDVNIDGFYGRKIDKISTDRINTSNSLAYELSRVPGSSSTARTQVNHAEDIVPVTVSAGGNIESIRLVLNKQARITAVRDINKLDLIGQNNTTDNVTLVSAGGSIDQGITVSGTKESNGTPYPEIVVGGPGTLQVQAGENISMGNSRGIQSIGNSMNNGFSGNDTDSNIIVSVGAKQTPADASGFFKILQHAGKDYSDLNSAGKNDEAKLPIEAARTEIKKYFDEPVAANRAGTLTMLDSEIRSGKGDIFIMARSDLNVGRTALQDPTKTQPNTGISTTFGGDINLYTGGDVNVNESRVMTFMGGNMIIWSDQGSINAGRGSKTTVSSSGDPDYKYDKNGNLESIILKVPAVGSGLRALTYDPDGSSGPLEPPEPGDIDAFAPNGIIDAGEAGIAGGKITLGATQVLNAKNISFSAGSVGVPTSSDSAISLGALGGNSNLADSSKMIETASAGGSSKESAKQKLSQAADDFLSKFLDVKVLGFDMDTISNDTDTKEELEKKKKK